jgi:hypothetical protein
VSGQCDAATKPLLQHQGARCEAAVLGSSQVAFAISWQDKSVDILIKMIYIIHNHVIENKSISR